MGGRKIKKPEPISGQMKPDELVHIRKYLRLSMRQLGEKIGGIGPKTVGKWENGDALVPQELADRIRYLVHGENTIVVAKELTMLVSLGGVEVFVTAEARSKIRKFVLDLLGNAK